MKLSADKLKSVGIILLHSAVLISAFALFIGFWWLVITLLTLEDHNKAFNDHTCRQCPPCPVVQQPVEKYRPTGLMVNGHDYVAEPADTLWGFIMVRHSNACRDCFDSPVLDLQEMGYVKLPINERDNKLYDYIENSYEKIN